LLALVTCLSLSKTNVMKDRVKKLKQTQNLSSLCTCAQNFIAQQSAVGLNTLGLNAGSTTLSYLS